VVVATLAEVVAAALGEEEGVQTGAAAVTVTVVVTTPATPLFLLLGLGEVVPVEVKVTEVPMLPLGRGAPL
jgi:hypothetical protein